MRKLLLLLVLSWNAHAASVADWRHDLTEMLNLIRAIHPSPFQKTGELTFLRQLAALQEALPDLTEQQRVVAAMRLVATIGDGHTSVQPRQAAFGRWYPIRVYEFTDGFFIISAHTSVRELAGAQILEIAGRPVAEVAEGARTLMSADNAFGRREHLHALHNAALMQGLGYADTGGRLSVRVRLRTGTIADRLLVPQETSDPRYAKGDSSFEWQFRREFFGTPIGAESEWITAFRDLPASAFRTVDWTRPPHLALSSPFNAKAFPERDAYYILTTQVDDSNFLPGFRKALGEIEAMKPRRLILDFRYNFGGDGSVVMAMIHEFIKRKDSGAWKELYLLTGRKTFSAGIMAIDTLIRNLQLTVIGEPAGAAYSSFGDATSRPLERIGMLLEVSTLRHELSSSTDLRDAIHVDIPAPFSSADYFAGRDPAVDPILAGVEMRSIPIIAVMEGGAAARKAYEEQRKRFANVPWWQPPVELELRRACDELQEAKKYEDALATCQLNADIHPWVWNVWLNLYYPQSSLGLPERLRSLKRVLEIDPNNFNRDVIDEALARGLRPRVFQFGSTVAKMETALAPLCATMRTRKIDPPFLNDVKKEQLQIDCEGYLFFGKPRHAELVFRDDSLEMVWVMTTPEEESKIRAALIDVYGAGEESANYFAYPKHRIALRRKPAEVLFYSDTLAPEW